MLPVGKRLNRGFKLKIPNLNSSIEPSRKELKNIERYAYRKFYLRPSYIMKRILKIRSFEDIKRHIKGGTALVKAFL